MKEAAYNPNLAESQYVGEVMRKLQEPFGEEMTYSYTSKDGETLTGLHVQHLIDRLNKVLGYGNWTFTHRNVKHVGVDGDFSLEINEKGNTLKETGDYNPYAVVAGVLSLCLHQEGTNASLKSIIIKSIEQYGGNASSDLGDAYKGAVTDAMIKCAQSFGIARDMYVTDKAEIPKKLGLKALKTIKHKMNDGKS